MMSESDIMEFEMNQVKTFKEYLKETEDTGNYVALEVDGVSDFWNEFSIDVPITGDVPPDYHCTLMYSKDTAINVDKVKRILDTSGWGESIFLATIDKAECFDAEDDDKSCLVLKLDCMPLHKIHELLKEIGLKHSYDEFKPHVTLRYNMSIPEAHFYKDKVNDVLKNKQFNVVLQNFKSQAINKDYI